MTDKQLRQLPEVGNLIYSACGGQMTFEPDTPRAIFREEWVFFCSPSCKDDFDRDPAISCLSPQTIDGNEL
ncbi:MAG: hypothetical protein ACNA8H_04760 [Anaerolineales bacterium]